MSDLSVRSRILRETKDLVEPHWQVRVHVTHICHGREVEVHSLTMLGKEYADALGGDDLAPPEFRPSKTQQRCLDALHSGAKLSKKTLAVKAGDRVYSNAHDGLEELVRQGLVEEVGNDIFQRSQLYVDMYVSEEKP